MKLISSFNIITSCFIILTACSTSSKANDAHAQQKSIEIKKQIDTKTFVVEVDRAVPMRGKSMSLSYGYNLKIKEDSAFAYLPYYGVATSSSYGGGEGGVKFEKTMENYQVTPTKKNDGWEIRFKITTSDYHYQVFLSIFDNGSSSINVSSIEKDAIWYYGSLKEGKNE